MPLYHPLHQPLSLGSHRLESGGMTRSIEIKASFISAIGVWTGLCVAVFHYGPQVPLLAAAQLVLIIWMTASVLRRYDTGIALPRNALTVSLTLFWGWLNITLLWSPVPNTSVINFWWVGSFALAFWAYTLAPDRATVWRWCAPLGLAGATVLCGYALVQVIVLGEPPRATFLNIHSFAALLVLVSLPTAAYFLMLLRATKARFAVLSLGAGLFCLWFTIATTQGRGTTISLLLGVAAFLALTWKDLPRRHVVLVVGLLAGAYLGANLMLQGAVSDRFATLADPTAAALPRWLIWRGSWQMVMDNPWFGIGLGNYYLAWPPYRAPEDSTLGFFAHNDYLQIWIEAGLPALLLLLAILASVLSLTIRSFRLLPARSAARVEIGGLFAGLFAVAVHSFLDFNFYILAISLTAGLILGRWHECVTAAVPTRTVNVQLRAFLGRRAHATIVILIALLPIYGLVALGVAEVFYDRAFALAKAGKLAESDRSFTSAAALTPAADRFYVAHADLFRFVLSRTPASEPESRRVIYTQALQLLEQAQASNPYRALVHDIRGRLTEEAVDLAGEGWRAIAIAEYQRALALNPRLLHTRLRYAHLLVATGDPRAALAVLEDGTRHWYYPEPALVDYYYALSRLHRDQGRLALAVQFDARAAEVAMTLDRLASARRPVREDAVTPRGESGAAAAGPIIAPKPK